MILLIEPGWRESFADEIGQMHRLRHRVFKGRLDWEVQTAGGFELDRFDALGPYYLLLRAVDGRVNGCVRLLPSTGPTMLDQVFPVLLDGRPAPKEPKIWESSRFALDLTPSAPKYAGGIGHGTYQLFAGMLEFGVSRELSHIVTVTDLRMERILRRAGWPLERISDPRTIGKTQAVAGYLDVTRERLEVVRRNGGIGSPVLWGPVALQDCLIRSAVSR